MTPGKLAGRADSIPEGVLSFDLLESIPEAFSALDLEWRYIYVNSQALRFCGMSREQFLGRSFWEVFPAAAGTEFEANVRRAMAEQIPISFEYFSPIFQRWHEHRLYPTPQGLRFFSADVTERYRTQAALRSSEARYRSLFETSQDGIVIVDEAGKLVDVNHSFSSMLKVPRGQLVGEMVTDYIDPSRLAEAREVFEALGKKESSPIEFPLRAADGSSVELEWSAKVNFEPGLHFFTCRDISTRKKVEADRERLHHELETERRRLRAVAEQMPSGLLIAEAPSGRLLFTNSEIERILGHKLPEVRTHTGYGRFGVIHEDGTPYRADEYVLTRALLQGEAIRNTEQIYLRGDGTRTTLLVSAAPVADVDGKIVAGVVVVTDIGERKRMESALRASNDGLVKANRELEEFAYIASHDLREPLRMVDSYTELLVRRYMQGDADAEEFAGYIRAGVRRMEGLIRDVLAYSRVLHAEKRPTETANLARSLESTLMLFREELQSSGAHIMREALPEVRANQWEVDQIFQNLISNALKYSKAGEPPNVQVTAERRGGEWLIAVRDCGIGFDMKYAERIFRLFQRLHSSEYPGTGLGLAICKRIVERHGGRIWAESATGEGSTLYFTLPAFD